MIDGDLGRSADTNGESDCADAAIDVKLPAFFAKPSTYVRGDQQRRGYIDAGEFQCNLASVGVSCQAQVNAEFRGPVEGVRVVAEQDVNGVRAHHAVNTLKIGIDAAFGVRAEPAVGLKIDADQVQGVNPFPN